MRYPQNRFFSYRRFLPVWVLCLALTSIPAFGSPAAQAPETDEIEGWPLEIAGDGKTFTVYQPQLESWDGHRIDMRTAISIQMGESEQPTFGVAWFSARTEVDKDERLATFDDLQIAQVKFPSQPENESTYLEMLQKQVAPKTKTIALDRLESALAIMEAEKGVENLPLKHDPPIIAFSTVPAILVYIDTEPVYRDVKGTKLERVINTRVLLLRDSAGRHYLHVFDAWMEAPAVGGPYTVSEKPPKDLEKALKETQGKVDLLEGGDPEDDETQPSLGKGLAPTIYIATRPTELFVTDGEPNYIPIEGTELLYVENTTGHIFKQMGDQKTYVLAAGRWFRASTPSGPWEHVPGESLPSDFTNIPDDSPKENVKASVPGTTQAQEALIANTIPQTAQVNRNEAKLTNPEFDGEPKLEPIEGTSLQYVVNSPTPIIRVDASSFYAVENGVWFAAKSVHGPWTVATSVPSVIYTIPPSSSLHYVTYVKVYHSTPEVVYVSYTPGYYGTCVYNGVVVYGTGYRYTPWVGSYWYGPPVTYGFGVGISYTPWTGWTFGFGFGWSWGAVTVGWGWGAYPWWGPVGWGWYYPYPYSYRPYWGGAYVGPRGVGAWGPGGWAATSGNVYHRWGSSTAVTRRSGGYNAWTGDRWSNQAGMSYNSRTGNLAAGQRSAVGNVYTGNYAVGGRGTVTNTRTGTTVTGGRATVGNTRTGQSTTVGGVRGSGGGGAVRAGDNVYAGRDGNVYRRGESGWEQHTGGGNWSGVQRPEQTRNLNSQQRARSNGQARVNNFRSSRGRAGARPRRRR